MKSPYSIINGGSALLRSHNTQSIHAHTEREGEGSKMGKSSTTKDAQALVHSLRSAYAATPTNLKVSLSLSLLMGMWVRFETLTELVYCRSSICTWCLRSSLPWFRYCTYAFVDLSTNLKDLRNLDPIDQVDHSDRYGLVLELFDQVWLRSNWIFPTLQYLRLLLSAWTCEFLADLDRIPPYFLKDYLSFNWIFWRFLIFIEWFIMIPKFIMLCVWVRFLPQIYVLYRINYRFYVLKTFEEEK